MKLLYENQELLIRLAILIGLVILIEILLKKLVKKDRAIFLKYFSRVVLILLTGIIISSSLPEDTDIMSILIFELVLAIIIQIPLWSITHAFKVNYPSEKNKPNTLVLALRTLFIILSLSILVWTYFRSDSNLLPIRYTNYILIANIFILLFNSIWCVSETRKIIDTLQRKSNKILNNLVLSAFSGPVRILLIALSFYGMSPLLDSSFFLFTTYKTGSSVLLTISFFLFFYRLSENIGHSFSQLSESKDNDFDRTQVEIIRFSLRIFLILLTTFIVIQQITGKNLNSLLAGLGIGGIAIAFGVQDVLKNIFGSFMIFADKPFKLGERILIEDYDGIIENIGFRSTRLRTMDGNLVVIPNEKVASVSIENVGKRETIRKLIDLKVPYNTPMSKINLLLTRLRELMDNHEGMIEEFPPRVYFNELGKDALNIRVLFWYSPPVYWDFMNFCEMINMKIVSIFEDLEIEFAYPTTTNIIQGKE
ncbi:mechanosensitive ion channel family protein [Spirochaeta cellobiosiphila]|uniref:mechanosensitive ion channel family protein n=1 Tax=Spirochaeta cellobiosiphila TaxID=504483 RepID=UPI00040442C0|nr:mechanosensitive ion channel family protein [Spirochaeta cellobiosiphila]